MKLTRLFSLFLLLALLLGSVLVVATLDLSSVEGLESSAVANGNYRPLVDPPAIDARTSAPQDDNLDGSQNRGGTLYVSSIKKSVTPAGKVKHGDELVYTLVISATPGAQVALHDPLIDNLTFVKFVIRPSKNITYADGSVNGALYVGRGVTGTVTITSSGQVTVSFVAEVDLSGTVVPPYITNSACARLVGSASVDCVWSNTVWNHTTAYSANITKSGETGEGVWVNSGDELIYTLTVFAEPGTQVALYDPITKSVTFARFVQRPGNLSLQNDAITGVLTVPSAGQIAVRFVVTAGVPGECNKYGYTITNQACVRPLGGTLGYCTWSDSWGPNWFLQSCRFGLYMPVLMNE